MKPAKLDLPTIWRGCDWGPVILKWKDANGDPFDFTSNGHFNWSPKAQSLNINLHASITNYPGGVTQLLLGKDLTIGLKLGVENWDWLWEKTNINGPFTVFYRFPPFLAGRVQIKDPVSTVGGDTPPRVPEELPPDTDPPEIEPPPTLPS